MSTKLYLLVASSLLVVGCSLFPSQQETTPITTNKIAENTSVSPTSMPQTTTPNEEATDSAKVKTYTLTEIAQHNKAADCWFAIDDKVYDVTGYINSNKHPGGAIIIEGCGKDATTLFQTKAGQGEPHSDKAMSFLPNFQIGILSK